MKNQLSLLLLAGSCFMVSCHNATQTTDTSTTQTSITQTDITTDWNSLTKEHTQEFQLASMADTQQTQMKDANTSPVFLVNDWHFIYEIKQNAGRSHWDYTIKNIPPNVMIINAWLNECSRVAPGGGYDPSKPGGKSIEIQNEKISYDQNNGQRNLIINFDFQTGAAGTKYDVGCYLVYAVMNQKKK